MSDVSQGPGWWQASDGRWYPPEQHPNARAALPPPGMAPAAAPGASFGPPPGGPAPGAPAASSGLSSGQKVLIAVVAVLVLGIGGCSVVVGALIHKGAKSLVGVNDCSFLPASQAADVIQIGRAHV